MDNLNNSKMLHAFSLPNVNFKAQMTANIDVGAHIKSIINCEAYLFDITNECLSNKLILKGKIGLKVVYLDQDDMLNTISSTSDFDETISNQDITSDCKVFCYDEQLSAQPSYDEHTLKVNINVNLKMFSVIDLSLNIINTNMDDLIVKNHSMNVCYYLNSLSNKYYDNVEITVPYKINKLLSICPQSSLQKVECEDGYINIEGQTIFKLIFEVDGEDKTCMRTICSNHPFRYQIKLDETTKDCVAQIVLKANHNNIEFVSELNENETTIKIDYEIDSCGCVFKTAEINCPDDLYSTKNDLEITFSPREFCQLTPINCFKVGFDGEIQLNDDNNVDEIIDLTNMSTLITQTYLSDNKLTLEGVAYANLIYLTEEKEIRSLNIEFPFSVSKDCNLNDSDELLNYNLTITSAKSKIKRGNVLNIDMEAEVCAYIITKTKRNILENINLKNEITYGDIAFQILIAKENETIWDFCKRAHCRRETIEHTNKEIPPVFQGGEKIVIFR